MKRNLQLVQDDAQFKRWLREQHDAEIDSYGSLNFF
jgi:hypothetical protein